MPPVKRFNELPRDLRRDLERRVLTGECPDYRAFQDELSALGYPVSRSAANRYYLKILEFLNPDTLPLRERPPPESLDTSMLLQEAGALTFHIRVMKARRLRVFEELESRRQPKASATAGGLGGGGG